MDRFLTSYTKINSKLIKDLNVRAQTIKLLEENLDSTFFDIILNNVFLDLSQARYKKAKKRGGVGLHYTKIFCIVKKTINTMKRQPNKW